MDEITRMTKSKRSLQDVVGEETYTVWVNILRELFNRAFTKAIKPSDLNANESIVNQLARILNVERLFENINKTLEA